MDRIIASHHARKLVVCHLTATQSSDSGSNRSGGVEAEAAASRRLEKPSVASGGAAAATRATGKAAVADRVRHETYGSQPPREPKIAMWAPGSKSTSASCPSPWYSTCGEVNAMHSRL